MSTSLPAATAPHYDKLPSDPYPQMQEPFSFRAADNLLKFSASLETSGKASAVDQELAGLIKSRSLDATNTQISFERDIEKISIVLSSAGDVLFYTRSGGNKIVNHDHRPAEMMTQNPLANYTFVSLSLPPRKPETAKPAAVFSKKIDLDPKMALTAIAASYIGFSNLLLGSAVNFGADKLTEGKIPTTAKNIFIAGAVLAFTPQFLLETLLITGAAFGAFTLSQNPNKAERIAEKAEELKNSLFENSKAAFKIGSKLLSQIAGI